MLEGKTYKQKKNPLGKYNDKKWNKVGPKDMVNIDEVEAMIYNDISLDSVYNKMDSIYSRKADTKKVGRPKGQKNRKHHEKEQYRAHD